mgnify:CR=1 FL=1
MRKIDLTGQIFSRLTVIGAAPSRQGLAQWLCKCICGKEKIIMAAALKGKKTRSCGCLQIELTSARSKVINRTHGATANRRPTTEWAAWMSMKDRCNNPNHRYYGHYGGRGIKISDEWLVFTQFLADMGNKPDPTYSLDRIDNNKGYCKENCRWASRLQQSNNTRRNRNVTMSGKTQSVSMWKAELGVSWRRVLKLVEASETEEIKPAEQ